MRKKNKERSNWLFLLSVCYNISKILFLWYSIWKTAYFPFSNVYSFVLLNNKITCTRTDRKAFPEIGKEIDVTRVVASENGKRRKVSLTLTHPHSPHIHMQCGLMYKWVNLAVHFEVFQILPKNLNFQKAMNRNNFFFWGVILLGAMFS